MRAQRLLAIVCLFITSMCCVQLLSIFSHSFAYNELLYPVSSKHVGNVTLLEILPKLEPAIVRNEIKQAGPANDLIKLIKQRKHPPTTPNPSSASKLHPGKALQQAVKRLSNGTNVGWLPAYNRTLYKLLHASPACNDDDIYVAVVVSAGKNFARRQAIRKTWGSQLKTVFVLGANETENKDLESEARIYKDIVQADFREGYYNLTYNTITALRWATIYCPNAEYVLKGDDDTWFNIDLVKTEVAAAADGPMILGKVFPKANRNKNQKSKWYTPNDVISQLTYPAFVSGAGYALTRDAVPLLYNKLLMEPLVLNLEDLFITGFLAEEIGITRKKVREFYNHRFPKLPVNGCTYGGVLQSHELTPSEMSKLWRDIRNPTLKC